jgi:hypothetical protein
MDEDLSTLPREPLIAEVVKLRNGMRKHRDAGGHELCREGGIRYRKSLDQQLAGAPRTSKPYGEEA